MGHAQPHHRVLAEKPLDCPSGGGGASRLWHLSVDANPGGRVPGLESTDRHHHDGGPWLGAGRSRGPRYSSHRIAAQWRYWCAARAFGVGHWSFNRVGGIRVEQRHL